MDEQAIFQDAWDIAAQRVNKGKHSKDSIRFFFKDGTTRKFDVQPMRDDKMIEEFVRLTLQAIQNHPIEALLLNYEAWFVDAPVTAEGLDEYLDTNPRPRDNPQRREGVSLYYEHSDGTIITALAEIRTVKKGKRVLEPLRDVSHDSSVETRMSHFFKKASRLPPRRDIIDEILNPDEESEK